MKSEATLRFNPSPAQGPRSNEAARLPYVARRSDDMDISRHRAQSPAMPVIGYLGPESPGPFASRLKAFHEGLAESGYVEGRNVAIEYRWAEGQYNRLPGACGRSGQSKSSRDRSARRRSCSARSEIGHSERSRSSLRWVAILSRWEWWTACRGQEVISQACRA